MQSCNSVTLDKNAMSACRAPQPYPALDGLRADNFSARLLQSNYAGCVSEVTSINQYIFHRLSLDGCAQDIAQTFRCIGMVEMTHMNLMGGAIVKLGAQPIYAEFAGNRCIPWTPKYVNYQIELEKMIEANIKQEKDSIAKYSHTICMLTCPVLKSLLERIVLDEQLHLQILQDLQGVHIY